jgi:hypothetical protein
MEVIHALKTLGPYWDAVERGDKTFEVRRNDRGFQRGDLLRLERWEKRGDDVVPDSFGRVAYRRVTYVLAGGAYGIAADHCVLGLAVEAAP